MHYSETKHPKRYPPLTHQPRGFSWLTHTHVCILHCINLTIFNVTVSSYSHRMTTAVCKLNINLRRGPHLCNVNKYKNNINTNTRRGPHLCNVKKYKNNINTNTRRGPHLCNVKKYKNNINTNTRRGPSL